MSFSSWRKNRSDKKKYMNISRSYVSYIKELNMRKTIPFNSKQELLTNFIREHEDVLKGENSVGKNIKVDEALETVGRANNLDPNDKTYEYMKFNLVDKEYRDAKVLDSDTKRVFNYDSVYSKESDKNYPHPQDQSTVETRILLKDKAAGAKDVNMDHILDQADTDRADYIKSEDVDPNVKIGEGDTNGLTENQLEGMRAVGMWLYQHSHETAIFRGSRVQKGVGVTNKSIAVESILNRPARERLLMYYLIENEKTGSYSFEDVCASQAGYKPNAKKIASNGKAGLLSRILGTKVNWELFSKAGMIAANERKNIKLIKESVGDEAYDASGAYAKYKKKNKKAIHSITPRGAKLKPSQSNEKFNYTFASEHDKSQEGKLFNFDYNLYQPENDITKLTYDFENVDKNSLLDEMAAENNLVNENNIENDNNIKNENNIENESNVGNESRIENESQNDDSFDNDIIIKIKNNDDSELDNSNNNISVNNNENLRQQGGDVNQDTKRELQSKIKTIVRYQVQLSILQRSVNYYNTIIGKTILISRRKALKKLRDAESAKLSKVTAEFADYLNSVIQVLGEKVKSDEKSTAVQNIKAAKAYSGYVGYAGTAGAVWGALNKLSTSLNKVAGFGYGALKAVGAVATTAAALINVIKLFAEHGTLTAGEVAFDVVNSLNTLGSATNTLLYGASRAFDTATGAVKEGASVFGKAAYISGIVSGGLTMATGGIKLKRANKSKDEIRSAVRKIESIGYKQNANEDEINNTEKNKRIASNIGMFAYNRSATKAAKGKGDLVTGAMTAIGSAMCLTPLAPLGSVIVIASAAAGIVAMLVNTLRGNKLKLAVIDNFLRVDDAIAAAKSGENKLEYDPEEYQVGKSKSKDSYDENLRTEVRAMAEARYGVYDDDTMIKMISKWYSEYLYNIVFKKPDGSYRTKEDIATLEESNPDDKLVSACIDLLKAFNVKLMFSPDGETAPKTTLALIKAKVRW